MSRFLSLLVSLILFLSSLWGLLLLWDLFSPDSSKGETLQFQKRNDVKAPLSYEVSMMPPSSEVTHVMRFGKGPVTTLYHLNSYGIRDQDNERPPRDSHLLISGCSFIFGSELDVEDSVTELVGKEHPKINVRNLGFKGGGLNTSLRTFDVIPLRALAPEDNGIFIYSFIQLHLARFFFHPAYLSWAFPFHPAYKFSDGKLVSSGQLKDYFSYRFIQALPKKIQPFLQRINQGVDYSDEEIDEFVTGVDYLKERYLKTYPKGRFIWLIHPDFPLPDWLERKFHELAHKRGIEYIDGRKDFHAYLLSTGTKKEAFHSQHNLHPNAAFNRYFSEWISRTILNR